MRRLILLAGFAFMLEANIRQFSPGVFPELPKTFAEELRRRGCTIPQVPNHKRSDVISGQFWQDGRVD